MVWLGQAPIFIVTKAAEAAAYLQGKVLAYAKLNVRIAEMQVRARYTLKAASVKGDIPAVREAGQILYDLSELREDYDKTGGKLRDLLEKLPGLEPAGLGIVPVIPLALMAVVIAVALAMAAIFRRANAQEKALALVESGVLTPAEAARLRPGPGGMFAGLAPAARYAAVGIGLYFGLPILAGVLKRRRR